jgi:hypothetical protein
MRDMEPAGGYGTFRIIRAFRDRRRRLGPPCRPWLTGCLPASDNNNNNNNKNPRMGEESHPFTRDRSGRLHVAAIDLKGREGGSKPQTPPCGSQSLVT